MSELEDAVRSIVAKNQRSRAEYSKLSARVVSLTLSGTQEEIDEFTNGLEDEFHRLLEGQGKDPTTGGTDGSATDAGSGTGQS